MPGITLTEEEVRKLTSCGNPDAAVLFLYRKAELPRETALAALHFTVPRMVGATDTLRQLGLWQEERPVHPTPERPQYTEEDLKREQQAGDGRFRNLVGEAQRRLGRTLSTEELKNPALAHRLSPPADGGRGRAALLLSGAQPPPRFARAVHARH